MDTQALRCGKVRGTKVTYVQGSGSARDMLGPMPWKASERAGRGQQAPFTPQPGAEQHVLPCWPPPGPAGTFIVARML